MAEKSVLTIVQDFCKRSGLPVPPVAVGAPDDTTIQVVGLLNEGIQDICDRYAFQQLTKLQQFTHANGTDYAAWDFATNTPDWKFNQYHTLWNLTNRIPLAGPVTLPQWQQIVTMLAAAAQYQYLIYGNVLRIYPVPDPIASTTFGFYYQSKYGVIDGTTEAETYTSDSATPKLPSYLIEADLKWRWKKEKGLPYAEDQRVAESMLVNCLGRSPQPNLNLDLGTDSTRGPIPGIFVQAGSWPV